MTFISPTLPNNVSPLDLPSHYQSVRERLMNGRVKRIAPTPKPQAVQVVEGPAPLNRPYTSRRKEIVAVVCEKHGFGLKEFSGPGRWPEIVAARAEAAWMLRTYCQMSFQQIATLLGRDHTTVLHLIRKYGIQFEQDREDIAPFRKLGDVVHAIVEEAAPK